MKIHLLENAWLKVFAIILGLLLWFHVATEKVYNHNINLPVSEIVLKDGLSLVGGIPDSLNVIVSATGKQLLRRKWRDRGLRLNANQYQAGRHNVTLNTTNTSLTLSDNEITLDEIVFPTAVTLNIDFELEKKITVVPDILATADEGFAIGVISDPDPAEVTIIGPRTIIQNLPSINTVRRELPGIRNDISLMLQVQKPDEYGITIEPDSVLVTVQVVPIKTRVFSNVPIAVYNVPSERTVAAQPPTISVELTGPPLQIDLLDRNALVASTDYLLRDSSGFAPVKVECPSRFKVKKISTDSVVILPQ